MSVLVTGATGFLGGHLTDVLIERGESVRALVRPGVAVDHLTRAGVDICWGDLADRASLHAAVSGVERVLHCAARTGVWGPISEYETANIRGLETLLTEALDAGVTRFVHVSSHTVLGNDVHGVADETAPRHTDPNPYGWSKVLAEQVLESAMREAHSRVTIVRPGWIYGPRDATSFARLAASIERGRMVQIGSGQNHVPLIYVRDVADGIVLASQAAVAAGRIYHLVNDEPVRQRDYLNAIASELGVPPPRLRIPYHLAMMVGGALEGLGHLVRLRQPPPLTRFGVQLLGGENRFVISRARQELGFSPRINLAEGVHQSVAWCRERRGESSARRGGR